MSPIRTGILVLALAALPAASHGQTAAPTYAFQCNAGVDLAMQSTGWLETQVLDYAAGLPKADECVRLFPTAATVFGKRADVHWGLGDYESAMADLTRAVELEPDKSIWLTHRADIRAEAEQDELALADYEAALRIDPTDSMALMGRANVRRYMGELADAIRDYDAVLARI